MVIKHKHSHYANAKLILLNVGEVKLENGEVDVPDEVGEIMIQQDDWYDPNEVVEKAEDKEEKDAEATQLDAEQKAEMIAAVKEMGHEELLETANSAKIKGANLFKAPEKIETLRNLIIKNIEKV